MVVCASNLIAGLVQAEEQHLNKILGHFQQQMATLKAQNQDPAQAAPQSEMHPSASLDSGSE